MPTPAIIPVTPGVGLNLDGEQVVVNGQNVIRENVVVADPSNPSNLLTVNSSGGINVTTQKNAQSPASPTSASVGTGSGQVLAANASRTGLVLVNLSSNTISLGLGAAAVLNSGITIFANGGVWEMDGNTFTTDAIFAIASGSSSSLAIQEFN
jgi:hypothetical protein